MGTFNLAKFKQAGIGNSRHLRDDLSTDELEDAFMNPYSPKEKYPGRKNQNQQFDVSNDGPNDGGVNADLDYIKKEYDDARVEMAMDPSRQFQISMPSSAPMMDSPDVGAINPAIGTAAETARNANPNNPDRKENASRLPNGQAVNHVNAPRQRMRNPYRKASAFNQLKFSDTSPLDRVWAFIQKGRVA